jgi:murein DD-endopeptidase MepM/ murein hydrolase activator NlpD
MLIPHTEKRVHNVQLSFFALGGIIFAAGLVVLAFIFSAARFSATANKLQSRSSDLASTEASLDAVRDETSQLLTASKRFDNALLGALGRVEARSQDSSADASSIVAQPGSQVLGGTTDASSGSSREVGELQRVTDYLEKSVDPLKTLGAQIKSQSAILTEVPTVWPVRGPSHIEMYYGQNEDPFTGQWYVNRGVDISTSRSGDPVVATADGRIASLGFDEDLGNYVIIQHSHGFVTRYGHLMAFRVAKGQKVQQGQIIGLLGNTGLTTGPDLHYEVHIGTGVIDPLKLLSTKAAAMATD